MMRFGGSAGSSDPSSLGVTRAKYPVQASRTNQLASVTATAFCKPANQPNIVRQGTKGCTVWLRCGSIAENSSNICNMQQSCLGSEGIQIENTIESHTHLRLHLRLIKFYHVLHVDICHNPNFKHTLGLSRVRPIETFSILESNVFSWFRVNGTCVCTILHIYRIFMNIGILNFETKTFFTIEVHGSRNMNSLLCGLLAKQNDSKALKLLLGRASFVWPLTKHLGYLPWPIPDGVVL
jgi:hypothetical protein